MENRLAYKTLRYGLIGLLVVMPFHAFLTTWLGSNFGHLLAVRAWKEVLLLYLTVVGLYYFFSDKKLFTTLLSRTINRLILIYAIWLLFVSTLHATSVAALSQGLAIDLRFLLVFVLMQIVVYYQPISKKLLYQLITIPALGVVAFGLLQLLVLPRDFLAHFGYNKYQTIPPFFTVDEQLTNLRYASTLSGPNTLGAYLVLPIMLLVGRLKVSFGKSKKKLLLTISFLVATMVVLYATQSRSAWLALGVSLGVYVLLSVPKKWRFGLLSIAMVGLLLVGFGLYQNRHTQFVADVVLHDDPAQGGEVSSNLGHLEAAQSAIKDVANQPLVGCGVGCAGPASVRTNQPKIAENYYLQVAQESGVVGLGLLGALIVLVGRELYKKRADSLALILFSSLIGLCVANLLLHTWADDTLAYVWWLAASVALYSIFPKITPKSDLNPI